MESTPTPSPESKDLDHLRSLAIGHKVMAGLLAVAPCCFIPHAWMGYTMLNDPKALAGKSGPPTPPMFGGFLFVVALAMMFFAIALAVFTYMAGKGIEERRGWKFVFVVNCLLCLAQPIGTILGVFTLVVLSRASVKALFDVPPPTE